MLNRKIILIVVGIVCLVSDIVLFSILSKDAWLSPEKIAIHIVIDNRTGQQIGPFEISDVQDTAPLQISPIGAYSVADVYYKNAEAGGENEIIMTDSRGNQYYIVSYFEQGQKGRVDLRVECVRPDGGLAGKKRDLTSGYFSFEWAEWGASTCG